MFIGFVHANPPAPSQFSYAFFYESRSAFPLRSAPFLLYYLRLFLYLLPLGVQFYPQVTFFTFQQPFPISIVLSLLSLQDELLRALLLLFPQATFLGLQ